MKNNTIKNYTILFLLLISLFLIYDNSNKNSKVSEKEKQLELLNTEVQNLKIEKNQLDSDKMFYKNLYQELASEYTERLHSLGIDEYIFTDTSR